MKNEIKQIIIDKFPQKACSQDDLIEFLIMSDIDPTELDSIINELSSNGWNFKVEEKFSDEDVLKVAVYSKVDELSKSFDELITYYNKKRHDTVGMFDLEKAQKEFTELCKKISSLDKPINKLAEFKHSLEICFNNNSQENSKPVPKTIKKTVNNNCIESGSLEIDFTGKAPCDYSIYGQTYQVGSWKEWYISICNIMYDKFGNDFKEFLLSKPMQGKKRNNFSESNYLMNTPKYIDSMNIYAETNHSAESLKRFVKKFLAEFNIDERLMIISLRR